MTMQAIDTTISACTPEASGEEFYIYIWIKVPTNSEFTPSGARLATLVMNRLLEAKLELAGVRISLSGSAGEFNSSIYSLKVDQLAPAIESVKATICENLLGLFAEISWFDSREAVMRIEHPTKGTRQVHEITAISDADKPFNEKLTSLLESLKRRG